MNILKQKCNQNVDEMFETNKCNYKFDGTYETKNVIRILMKTLKTKMQL